MKKILLFFGLSIIGFYGCQKTKPVCAGCGSPTMFQGEIVARINDSASIESVFSLMDSMSLPIKNVNGFQYTSSWPADSFHVITTNIRSRAYIDSLSQVALVYVVTLHANLVTVKPNFLGMNLVSQQDWLALQSQMMLTDISDSMKIVHIQVPNGLEQFWADKLNTYSIVKHADVIWLAP